MIQLPLRECASHVCRDAPPPPSKKQAMTQTKNTSNIGRHITETGQEEPAVSVIIPVYQVEAYIRRGIECLLAQTLHAMEFIFVDDCGKDGSMDIVREYAVWDSRIRILANETNKGAGASRNRGIEAARGKYIAFFDPDDTCDGNMYEVLFNKAEEKQAFIVKCLRTSIFPNGKREKSTLNNRIRSLMEQGRALYSVFTYEHTTAIFLREHVELCHAKSGTTKVDEDTTFLLMVTIGQDKRFVTEDTVCYHYRRRDDSLSWRDYDYCCQQVAAKKEKIEFLNHKVESDQNYVIYATNALNHVANLLLPYAFTGMESEKDSLESYLRQIIDFIRAIQGYRHLPENGMSPEARLLYRLSLQESLPQSCATEFVLGMQKHMEELQKQKNKAFERDWKPTVREATRSDIRLKLLDFIPLLKVKRREHATSYILFHLLPILKIKCNCSSGKKVDFLLFGCLPLWSVRKKEMSK